MDKENAMYTCTMEYYLVIKEKESCHFKQQLLKTRLCTLDNFKFMGRLSTDTEISQIALAPTHP